MTMLDSRLNRKIGKTMIGHRMLAPGDRVLVAVSGGIDSLVLTWLLDHWRRKTPFTYELLAVHIDMGFDPATAPAVARALNRLPVPYLLDDCSRLAPEIDGCHACARLRRKRLFDLAAVHRCNRLAFGHHADDMLETLLLNMCYAGNLSTLLPRQDLFGGRLTIIRPLAGLHKHDVWRLADLAGLAPVKTPCPFGEGSRRQKVRQALALLADDAPPVRGNMLAALYNVKSDYLPRTQDRAVLLSASVDPPRDRYLPTGSDTVGSADCEGQ